MEILCEGLGANNNKGLHRMDHRRFNNLTGHDPFPWQCELYDRFLSERTDNIPAVASIPTGLGKTNVIAVWLLGWLENPARLPRRLIYVVNRRTVVDQTTHEVTRLRKNLPSLSVPECPDLAISTLRGQHADDGAWSADPSRPAVICGTVDMIGSRLLFSGYRIGFKSQPLHAGLLGQDALLVHDEAHLEPAFQKLVERIEQEQREFEKTTELPWPKLRVMALSATSRGGREGAGTWLTLRDADHRHPEIRKRIDAPKALRLHPCGDEKKELVRGAVVERSLSHQDSGHAVLVFMRGVEDALDVREKIEKQKPGQTALLTGTLRGLERDRLVRDPVFIRFLPESDRPDDVPPAEGTVFLVCTSAGEVGVNLSADHMVCDLSTLDSMAQRIGRVNRFGDRDDTRVDVIHPTDFGEKKPDSHRKATLDQLAKLPDFEPNIYGASPRALGELLDSLDEEEREAAFAPEPVIPEASDILFDAWALTTIRGHMPGRPPVAPYLHGVSEWEPPRTGVAWREEVGRIVNEEGHGAKPSRFLQDRYPPEELLEDYPIKPHELLSDRPDRVYEALMTLIAKPKKSVSGEKRQAALERALDNAEASVWLIDDRGSVAATTLGDLLKDDKKRVVARLADATVLLPPSVGGLSGGMLDGSSEDANDVADEWYLSEQRQECRRLRLWDDHEPPAGMALLRTIDTDPDAEEAEPAEEESDSEDEDTGAATGSRKRRFWYWYARPRDAEDATPASIRPVTWEAHTEDVVAWAKEFVGSLDLPNELKQAVILAAELHDLGKKREMWQRSIGNPNPRDWHAKPGKPENGPRWRPRRINPYRHEFGSLLDVLEGNGEHSKRLNGLPVPLRDVVLHLIAAHHGYARPHFPKAKAVDPDYTQSEADEAVTETMRRYARLQRRYGRWGLAYLESLLRAADWAASANPTTTTDSRQEAAE